MDDDKTPVVDPPVIPEVKPTVKPTVSKPNVSDPVDDAVDLYLSQNEPVSKDDFMELQKQLLELQEDKEKADIEKDKLEREYAFKELETLSPKHAKINEKSSTATLKIVLDTVKETKAGFPSFEAEPPADPLKPKIPGIVGYKNPDGTWSDNPDYV